MHTNNNKLLRNRSLLLTTASVVTAILLMIVLRGNVSVADPPSATTVVVVEEENVASSDIHVPPSTGNETIYLSSGMTSWLVGNGVKIQIASDLHLEVYQDDKMMIPHDIIVPQAPILALLGDIGLAYTPALKDFLHLQADRFQHVLYIGGNHEYYNKRRGGIRKHTVQQQYQWLQRVCQERDNLHFVERQVVDIDGVVIILATTLWSEIPQASIAVAELSMNDYHISYVTKSPQDGEFKQMTTAYTNRWYATSLAWLEQQLQTYQQKQVVVLTHHTPALQGTSNPRFDHSPLNVWFSSDLTRLLGPPVHTWVCGHTHFNFDTIHHHSHLERTSGTRLVSNQRGYPGQEKKDYKKEGILVHILPS